MMTLDVQIQVLPDTGERRIALIMEGLGAVFFGSPKGARDVAEALLNAATMLEGLQKASTELIPQ